MKFFACFSLLFVFACQGKHPSPSQGADLLPYSTTSDSALHYYRLGWRQIMDEGRYGPAEVTYRKALSFDPDFLVGQAVLARLSLDSLEREGILRTLETSADDLTGDERKVLTVYRDLVRLTNLRTRDPDSARTILPRVLMEGEEKLRELVYAYPEEVYLKCEYLELLNANRGPEIALDSLAHHTRERHVNNPFLLGFAASLEAERDNHEHALDLARRTETAVADPFAPKAYAVYADVYLAMDSTDRAISYAQRAVDLDARNLDASRLLARAKTKKTPPQ